MSIDDIFNKEEIDLAKVLKMAICRKQMKNFTI